MVQPFLSADNWVPEMIEVAGRKRTVSSERIHTPILSSKSWRHVRRPPPELILISPCGYGEKQARDAYLSNGASERSGNAIPAVQSGTVYALEANSIFRDLDALMKGIERHCGKVFYTSINSRARSEAAGVSGMTMAIVLTQAAKSPSNTKRRLANGRPTDSSAAKWVSERVRI